MTAHLADADGTPMRRTPDGDLVPVHDDPPPIPAGASCAEHTWEVAARCRCCHAEVLAGDRPRHYVGRRWPT